ncbi:hypothetical protein TNCT_1831 [Trichonephila clavata]|uniref:Uncharacterized protein n=1 Tax=Trichonephila clavata TaxID=2740835 RepID=A0A8X6IPZ1_TRICU|nr:hypothetical protein TNCT_1831 [Trichonephila clavata]
MLKPICSVVCHQKCEKLTPNLCGINQKLVSEVLESVKEDNNLDRDEKRSTESQNSNSSIKASTSASIFSTPSVEDSPKDNIPKKLKFREYGVDDFEFLQLLGKGSFGKMANYGGRRVTHKL